MRSPAIVRGSRAGIAKAFAERKLLFEGNVVTGTAVPSAGSNLSRSMRETSSGSKAQSTTASDVSARESRREPVHKRIERYRREGAATKEHITTSKDEGAMLSLPVERDDASIV